MFSDLLKFCLAFYGKVTINKSSCQGKITCKLLLPLAFIFYANPRYLTETHVRFFAKTALFIQIYALNH